MNRARKPKIGKVEGARKGVTAGKQLGETLADVVLERTTLTRGLDAIRWVGCWGLFYDANDREPRSVEEVATCVGKNLRTVYRWQAAFREVFPEYSTPATLWAIVHDQAAGDDPDVLGLQLGAAQL